MPPNWGKRSAACCAFNGLNADTLSECAALIYIKDRESGGGQRPTIRRVWGRRFLAATVIVPPDVAERLNTDAMAVLAVIRNEAQTSGKCSLPVAQIAARANIGRAKVRAAIRLAQEPWGNIGRANTRWEAYDCKSGPQIPVLTRSGRARFSIRPAWPESFCSISATLA
jgi:hypothetical protein